VEKHSKWLSEEACWVYTFILVFGGISVILGILL